MKSAFGGSIKKKIFAGAVGLVGLALAAGVTFAVFGSKLDDFVPTPSGNGRAVAFDPATGKLYYTLTSSTQIHITDANHTLSVSINPGVLCGALAWDAKRGKLWCGAYDGSGDVYTVDPVSGVKNLEFNFAATDSCYGTFADKFYDGLSYDEGPTLANSDDILWVSGDAAKKLYKLDLTGAVLGNFPVPNNKCNTGIAVNGKYLWLAVQSGPDQGPHEIYRVDKSNPTAVLSTILFNAGDNPGPEDLELDLKTFAPDHCALWSNQFGANHLIAWELEDSLKNECAPPDIALDPPTATNEAGSDHSVTATVKQGTQPLQGVLVSFSVTAGPNSGEVSDPGECSVDPNCNTDVAGQTSWTYTSNSAVGTDVIVACFTDEQKQEHCTRAQKDWVDTTPPKAACIETVNPHGKNVPPAGSTTLPGPRGGQNEDGFYELLAKDNLPGVQIFVNGFGSFNSGDKIKATEAPGAIPSQKKIGSIIGQAGAVLWHLILNSDPVMTAVDAAGNKTSVTCLVPPPPK